MENNFQKNINKGIQEFKEENHYYANQKKIFKLSDVATHKKMFPFSFSVIANIVSFIADVIAIWLAYNQIRAKGSGFFSDPISKNYFQIVVLLFIVWWWLLIFNYFMFTKKWAWKIRREDKYLYLEKPNRCKECGAKTKITDIGGYTLCQCKRNSSHKFYFDFTKCD